MYSLSNAQEGGTACSSQALTASTSPARSPPFIAAASHCTCMSPLTQQAAQRPHVCWQSRVAGRREFRHVTVCLTKSAVPKSSRHRHPQRAPRPSWLQRPIAPAFLCGYHFACTLPKHMLHLAPSVQAQAGGQCKRQHAYLDCLPRIVGLQLLSSCAELWQLAQHRHHAALVEFLPSCRRRQSMSSGRPES